jgi:hypothetical protein
MKSVSKTDDSETYLPKVALDRVLIAAIPKERRGDLDVTKENMTNSNKRLSILMNLCLDPLCLYQYLHLYQSLILFRSPHLCHVLQPHEVTLILPALHPMLRARIRTLSLKTLGLVRIRDCDLDQDLRLTRLALYMLSIVLELAQLGRIGLEPLNIH